MAIPDDLLTFEISFLPLPICASTAHPVLHQSSAQHGIATRPTSAATTNALKPVRPRRPTLPPDSVAEPTTTSTMFTVGRKCEGLCGPHNRPHSSVSLLFHSLPFIVTFTVVALLVLHRLFPVLCTQRNRHPYPYNSSESRHRKRIAALAFSTTLGATGVLAELILCEVSDWVDAEARRVAFRVTVSVLLLCLIVVIPANQIVTVVEATKVGTWRWRNQMLVIGGVFAAWLWVFWNVGDVLPMRRQEFSLWQSCE